MDRLDQAFAAVPREWFLPENLRSSAHLDRPLPIGHGQTNSQPHTVHDMLGLLDVRPGQRVLDVGAGSGWTTALLAWLTSPGGLVVGTESVPSLREWGASNLAQSALLNEASSGPASHARIEAAHPTKLGFPAHAPYDRILVSANARAIPDQLLDQLSGTGILVMPVRGRMLRVTRGAVARGARASVRIEEFGRYLFVPLIEPTREPGSPSP